MILRLLQIYVQNKMYEQNCREPQHLLEKLQSAKQNHHQKHNFCCGTVHLKELLCSGGEHHIKSAEDKAATTLPLRARALCCCQLFMMTLSLFQL